MLACEPPPAPPPAPPGLPLGTYTESCDGCALEMHGDDRVLRCEQCKGADGLLRPSALTVGSCGTDEVVGNHDGVLTCERGQGEAAATQPGPEPEPRSEL